MCSKTRAKTVQREKEEETRLTRLSVASVRQHDCDANTELARDDKDVVSVVARRDIRKGDEIALF